MGYVMAVRANHVVSIGPGRTATAACAARMIPHQAWHRMRTGSGTKGTRHYDWAMLEVTSDDTPGGHDDGHSVLLARRHRYTGTLSFYRCWTPGPVPLSPLIAIASARLPRADVGSDPLDLGGLQRVRGDWHGSFAAAGFEAVRSTRLANPQILDRDGVVAFFASMGWIADLADDERLPLLDKVRSLLMANTYRRMWETDVHWTQLA
jgi:hypothetical protein